MITPVRGCMMSDSLYVKANGEMPCWDDIGETLTLRKLDESALQDERELPIFHGVELQRIRKAFISGTDPYPGLCDFCAVRGHGEATILKPSTMEVLHLEPSYLCHLSCPSCIPAKERRALKLPPYHMTTGLLDGLLRQLVREGVEHIRFIHFEGRGDPLVNPRLSELIGISKRYFPNALISVTTHCSYPYQPGIVRSELDVLRASIDGATSESYAKYRVGGSFERAIDFLRKLRDERIRNSSLLRVEWKYILFEWNDSPDEMKRASELAKELQVHLTFVRTHSPGHSWRFRTNEELYEYVQRFLPGSAIDQTYQLKRPSKAGAAAAVTGEHVAGLLALAVDSIRTGDNAEALKLLAKALKYDPQIVVSDSGGIGETIRSCLPFTLANARSPSTLTWLAAVSREVNDTASSDALLSRYVEVAPDAPDRKHVMAVLQMPIAVEHARRTLFDLARADLRRAICLELNLPDSIEISDPMMFCLERSDCPPWLAAGVATVIQEIESIGASRKTTVRSRAMNWIRHFLSWVARRQFAGCLISSIRCRIRSSSKPSVVPRSIA